MVKISRTVIGILVVVLIIALVGMSFFIMREFGIFAEGQRYGTTMFIADRTVELGEVINVDIDPRFGGTCPSSGSPGNPQFLPKNINYVSLAVKVDDDWYFNNPKFGSDAQIESLGAYVDNNFANAAIRYQQGYHEVFQQWYAQAQQVLSPADSPHNGVTCTFAYPDAVPNQFAEWGDSCWYDLANNCVGNDFVSEYGHWAKPGEITNFDIDTTVLTPGEHTVFLYAMGADNRFLASHSYASFSTGYYHLSDYYAWCEQMKASTEDSIADELEPRQARRITGVSGGSKEGTPFLDTAEMCREEMTIENTSSVWYNPIAFTQFYVVPPECTYNTTTEMPGFIGFGSNEVISADKFPVTPLKYCYVPAPTLNDVEEGVLKSDFDLVATLAAGGDYRVPIGQVYHVPFIFNKEEAGINITCTSSKPYDFTNERCAAISGFASFCGPDQYLQSDPARANFGVCLNFADICAEGNFDTDIWKCALNRCTQSQTSQWLDEFDQCGEYIPFGDICPAENWYYTWADNKCFKPGVTTEEECTGFATEELNTYNVYDCPAGKYKDETTGTVQCRHGEGEPVISTDWNSTTVYRDECSVLNLDYDSSQGVCVGEETGTQIVCEAPTSSYGFAMPEDTTFERGRDGFWALYSTTPDCQEGTEPSKEKPGVCVTEQIIIIPENVTVEGEPTTQIITETVEAVPLYVWAILGMLLVAVIGLGVYVSVKLRG